MFDKLDDLLIRFCENPAANAVLLYFAQQAKDNDIDYIVQADIPGDIFVSDTDISVLFGNLIENAGKSIFEQCSKAARFASRSITPLPERSGAQQIMNFSRPSTRDADSAHSR